LALEPLPFPREALLELVRRNGFTQVRVLPVAAGASEGSMQLHVTAGASGLISAYARDNASVPVEVERTTLDAVVEKSGGPPPKLLKIDVEGFEFDVLKGAARLLTTENAPLVLFESDQALLAPSRGTFADIQQTLVETGIPGLLIALWAAVAALRAVRSDPWLLAAVASVLMHVLVDFDLQISAIPVLLVCLVGMRSESVSPSHGSHVDTARLVPPSYAV
jgi:FkbM family methyltransferase